MLESHDFEGGTFLSLSAGSSGHHLIDQAFNRDAVRRVLRVETSLSEIMCGMVSSGLGVEICDPFTAREFESRGVVVRRFEAAHHLLNVLVVAADHLAQVFPTRDASAVEPTRSQNMTVSCRRSAPGDAGLAGVPTADDLSGRAAPVKGAPQLPQ